MKGRGATDNAGLCGWSMQLYPCRNRSGFFIDAGLVSNSTFSPENKMKMRATREGNNLAPWNPFPSPLHLSPELLNKAPGPPPASTHMHSDPRSTSSHQYRCSAMPTGQCSLKPSCAPGYRIKSEILTVIPQAARGLAPPGVHVGHSASLLLCAPSHKARCLNALPLSPWPRRWLQPTLALSQKSF